MTGESEAIDETLVRQLVEDQFPRFAHLAITAVQPGGWDNRTFRLGEELVVRLPSAACYAPQIAREAVAFEALAGKLPAAIPQRVASGGPGRGYPHGWAINRWIAGSPAGDAGTIDLPAFAGQCGRFLARLHDLEAGNLLPPGPENFHRGAGLGTYAPEVEEALTRLSDEGLRARIGQAWSLALESDHDGVPCWVHGDFYPWNLLVDGAGTLCGVIDWGLAATGDPACDLALGWTCFESGGREALYAARRPDPVLWDRARGWSLWKAVTLATGINAGVPADIAHSRAVLQQIADDPGY